MQAPTAHKCAPRCGAPPQSRPQLCIVETGEGRDAHSTHRAHAPTHAREAVLRPLACMAAGFVLCNHLNKREETMALLHKCLPPLLAFFFFSTGSTMRVHALRRTWPAALALFGARLIALWCGVLTGTMCAGGGRLGSLSPRSRDLVAARGYDVSAPIFADQRCCGWAAYVTQRRKSMQDLKEHQPIC